MLAQVVSLKYWMEEVIRQRDVSQFQPQPDAAIASAVFVPASIRIHVPSTGFVSSRFPTLFLFIRKKKSNVENLILKRQY